MGQLTPHLLSYGKCICFGKLQAEWKWVILRRDQQIPVFLDCPWDQSDGLNNNPDFFKQFIMCCSTLGQGDLFMLKTSNSIMNFVLAHVCLRLIVAIFEAPECESGFLSRSTLLL